MKLNKSKQLIVAAASLALLTSVYGNPKDTPAPATGADAPATQASNKDKEAKPVKDTFDSLTEEMVALIKKRVEVLGTAKDETSAHKAAKALLKSAEQHVDIMERMKALGDPSEAELDRFDKRMTAVEKSVEKDHQKHMRTIITNPPVRAIIIKAMKECEVIMSKAPDFE